MRVEDVPPGLLVIASEREGKVYCLECERCFQDDRCVQLTEDDVAERKLLGSGLYCAGCAFVFYSELTDPLFIPLVGPVGCPCQELGCQNVASWCFVPVPSLLCDVCYERCRGSDVCPCCGEWYPARKVQCPHCGYVFDPVVVVPGLCEFRSPQSFNGKL
jgi:hypothetical protein